MGSKSQPGQSTRNVAKFGVDDLVMLTKISEDAIVDNMKKRYDNDLIYTYIGPVLISINPYRSLNNAGEQFVPQYHGKFPHENPPHLYALAEEAYRSMKADGGNQCVLISGESGAGKTEAAKIIMGYISFVTGRSEHVEYVKSVVLESNPLLEAFGNAKTLRNNNSSRFGKYFEIQFDYNGDPCGGKITNYLLEKSRVVYQQPGERNFHFFYNLLAGASQYDQQQLSLYSASDYYYVNQGQAIQVDGIDDRQDYEEVRNAMNVVGMSEEEQANLLYIVAAVLHLGSIYFVEGQKGNAAVHDRTALQFVSSLLYVDPQTLERALLFRVLNTGGSGGASVSRVGSTYNVPQNPEQASGARDALARELYSRLFDWIVNKINIALQRYEASFQSVIGILDIFGFEIFDHNGFEQFCINYVNEKLQQYFIELTLKAEQEEYVREGIQWTPIDYFNNKIVCELMEAKVGIFSLLDDVCYTIHAQSGSGTDLRLLEKLSGLFNSHPHFSAFNGAFQIKHYAGNVTYDVEGFSDKNKDTLFSDLIEMVQCSSNPFLVSLFPEDTSASQKKRPTTAGFKIKTSANALMQTLSACNPHYVRCIKPNDNKRAHDWDSSRVHHQVKYLGLLENVRVRRAGFAYRAPFDRFLNRYKKLSRNTWGIWGEWTGSAVQGCEVICRDVNLDAGQWQMGRSKIFIRHPETLFHLEELLERKDFDCANRIKRGWKKYRQVKHALEQRAIIANIFKNHKERQRGSINRDFSGDYIRYEENFGLQDIVKQNGGAQEEMVFADVIVKVNRRGKAEKRFFLISNSAFYVICQTMKNKQIVYKLTRRTALSDISSVSLSTLADNYLVIHVPSEYDNLIENDKKTEIVAILMEYIDLIARRKLQVNFSDRISYQIKGKSRKEAIFIRNDAVPSTVLKGGKVNVPTGLPKDTDSTPNAMFNRAQASGFKVQSSGGPLQGSSRGGTSGPRGPVQASGMSGRPQCRALYDFQAENPDELSFSTGQVIDIVSQENSDWWTGILNGREGIFPANYVELIPQVRPSSQPRAGGVPANGSRGRANSGGGGPARGGAGGPGQGRGGRGQPRGGPARGGGAGTPGPQSRGSGSPRGGGTGGPPRGGRGMGLPPPRGRAY